MEGDMIKIIIADDHEIVRAGLKQIIANHPSMEVTGEAADGRELLAKVAKHDYDVVLLDLQMPGWNGLEILKRLKTDRVDLPVLVLSVHKETQYAVRALKAGAAGYLTKVTASEELVMAIERVCQGGRYINQALMEKLAESIAHETDKHPHEYLSDREFQVMCMLASGKTVSDISNDLFLSVKTVSTYRRRILEKMHMENNNELICYAIKNKLLDQ